VDRATGVAPITPFSAPTALQDRAPTLGAALSTASPFRRPVGPVATFGGVRAAFARTQSTADGVELLTPTNGSVWTNDGYIHFS
jgi:hypothetical protein